MSSALDACSKVPALGWAQIIAHGGFVEFSGGFMYHADGRLAMMAMLGMFFQYGLTGSAWEDGALYNNWTLRAYEI